MTPYEINLMREMSTRCDEMREMVTFMFESLERIASGKTKNPVKDAFETIKGCAFLIEPKDMKCQ